MRRQQIAAPRCGSETLLGRTDAAGILGQARRLGVSYHDESSIEMRYELASRRREDLQEQRAESLRARQQDEDDQDADIEQPSIEEDPLPLPGAE